MVASMVWRSRLSVWGPSMSHLFSIWPANRDWWCNHTTWGSTLQHDLSVSGTLANGCCAVVHHSNGLGDVNDRAEAWAYLCMYAHADAPHRYKRNTMKFQQRMNHFRVLTYSLLQLQCSCRTRKDFVFFCLFVCFFRLCIFCKVLCVGDSALCKELLHNKSPGSSFIKAFIFCCNVHLISLYMENNSVPQRQGYIWDVNKLKEWKCWWTCD